MVELAKTNNIINQVGYHNHFVGTSIYEKYLKEKTFRPIAMQALASGAIHPQEAIEYLAQFPKIESVLFGASSKANIEQTKDLIESNLV